jgi:hypothetical protein
MVNADRIKRKLPCLLCDGDTGNRVSNNAFMRNRYRLRQFQKRKPQRFNYLTNQLCSVLGDIDREMAETIKTE